MTQSIPTVSILLSTYNGNKYLHDQIKSLLDQDYANYNIFIRDDSSVEKPFDIINNFVTNKIFIVNDFIGNIGPSKSFLRLLQHCNSDIYMFCDQDDVWRPNKVSLAVESIIKGGINNSILYHTDLTVVDSGLNILSPSFMSSLNYDSNFSLKDYCVNNYVVGCTVAITHTLKIRMLKEECFEARIAMHDWWIALWSLCFGIVMYEPSSTILYRQHESNAVGVTGKGIIKKIFTNNIKNNFKKISSYKYLISDQATDFIKCYGCDLTPKQRSILFYTSKISGHYWFFNWLICLVNHISFKRFLMNFLFLITPSR